MAGMPLAMVRSGETATVKKIGGRDEARRFLESLGFVEGTRVTVVAEMGSNLIVRVKDTRVALSKAMANKIQTGEGQTA